MADKKPTENTETIILESETINADEPGPDSQQRQQDAHAQPGPNPRQASYTQPMSGSVKRETSTGRVVWGLIFLAAAAAIIMGGLGWLGGVSAGNIIWAVILIVILIASLRHFLWFCVFFPLAFLTLIFDEYLIGEDLPMWPLIGGALCLSIAFSIFFAGRRKKRFMGKHFASAGYNGGAGRGYCGNATDSAHYTDGLNGSFVRAEASFSNTIKYVNSENLKRAALECSFASMDVYFDNAKITEGNAAIIVDVSFGALNLYVPKEWRISVSVGGGFSNTEEKNIPSMNVIKTADVILLGDVSFGGLTVTYV
jgi:hypothetical protein